MTIFGGENITPSILLFLKGLLMGFADVIPGVSGGTMALITGIYEELILALKSIDPRIVTDPLIGEFGSLRERLRDIRYRFLIPLGLGIGVALLVGSQFIRYLLNNYPPYTYSFFFGLILASAGLVYLEIPRVRLSVAIASMFGALLALFIVGLSSGAFNHALWFIALSGAVAVCAMILPGISGAFILLLLGQYEYVLEAVGNLSGSLPTLIVFGLGAIAGLGGFSRIISFALDRWRSVTLGVLVGLMVGALRKPVEVIVSSPQDSSISFSWSPATTITIVGIGLAGVVAVVGLGYVRHKEEEVGETN